MPRIARTLRSQRGQTAAEYMGILLLVVAIVGVLAVSGAGGQIAGGVKAGICKVLGEGCESPAERRADGLPPLDQCVTGSGERGIGGSVKAFWVEIGGGVKALREERADGTVRITIAGNAKAGLEFSSPGVDVDAGRTEAGTGKREIEVAANGEAAKSWIFDSGEDADRFTEDVIKKVTAVIDPRPNFPGTDDDADIELPPATQTTVQGGVSVSGSAELGSGTGLEGNLGAGIGATFNERTGQKTVFFEVAAGGGVSGGSSPFALGGSAEGKTRIAITYDKDGNEESMRVIGQLDVTADANLKDVTEGKDLEAIMSGASKLTATGSEQAGGRLVVDSTLPLKGHPENLAALDAFIDGRDPETGEPVSRVDSGAALFDRFTEEASVNARVYAVTKSDAGVDVDAGAFGLEAKYTTEDTSLLDAYYRDLRTGEFKRWEECTRTLS